MQFRLLSVEERKPFVSFQYFFPMHFKNAVNLAVYSSGEENYFPSVLLDSWLDPSIIKDRLPGEKQTSLITWTLPLALGEAQER